MAQFNTSCSSVPDASYKFSLRQKQCALSSVGAKIAAFEEKLSGVSNTTSGTPAPKPHIESRFTIALNIKPSQSLKPAETQSDTVSSGCSLPPHTKIVVMKSAVVTNTDAARINSITFASTKARPMYYNRVEITKMLKPETQQSDVPSFPKVRHSTNLSLAQQNILTKEQSLIDGNVGVENIISSTPPKLPEMQKPIYISKQGARNKLQIDGVDPSVPKKKLPTVLALSSPPTKPKRPPNVNINLFRRNLEYLREGPGMKMPPFAVPSHLHPPSSSNHAAALSQQLDKDKSYKNVGVMTPPPLPLEEHPSKRTESLQADSSDDMYEELDDKWREQEEKTKKQQESKSGKDDANHGKVTKKKQAEPKGTINPEEMKGQQKQAKKEKKNWFEIKRPVHGLKGGKALGFKDGESDSSLNQAEIVEVVQNPGPDDLEEKEETEPCIYPYEDVYDDVGAPGEAYRTVGEDDLYVDVLNPDTRDYPLPLPPTYEDDVYDDVDYEDDNYGEADDGFENDCVYENA